jgi:hypothetical protein
VNSIANLSLNQIFEASAIYVTILTTR